MAHGSYEHNGERVGATRQHGHDLFVKMEPEAHTVGDLFSWPPGGYYTDEHHQQSRHHHHLSFPPSANTSMEGVPPAIPWGQLSAPGCRWSTNDGTGTGIGIGIGIGISEQQSNYDDDHRWGRGHQHQHYQVVVGGSGVGQRLPDAKVEPCERATLASNRWAEETPSLSPKKELGALDGRESGAGGSGASARELTWPSTKYEFQGRRKISVKQTQKAVGPVSVKDTMSWPLAYSMSWRSPPLAPLPQLPSPHQLQKSGAGDKNESIATPCSHETSTARSSDGAGQAPFSTKREGGDQRLKRMCQHPNCHRSPSFSKVGQRAVYCAKHKLEGMVNVVSRKCAAPGCAKGPSYARPGDKKPLFCSGHRGSGHINVVSPRCAHDGCRKGPSFGCGGTGNRAAYCAKHKLAGMVNVISRSCKEEGCNRAPSFAFEGERASYCGKHKRDGHRNVISRRCDGPNCTKVPSYGKPGDLRPTLCAHHKSPGAINLLTPRCAAPGCAKGPVSKNGGQKLLFCRVHSVVC